MKTLQLTITLHPASSPPDTDREVWVFCPGYTDIARFQYGAFVRTSGDYEDTLPDVTHWAEDPAAEVPALATAARTYCWREQTSTAGRSQGRLFELLIDGEVYGRVWENADRPGWDVKCRGHSLMPDTGTLVAGKVAILDALGLDSSQEAAPPV